MSHARATMRVRSSCNVSSHIACNGVTGQLVEIFAMDQYSLSHMAGMRVSDEDLTNDLVRVASDLGKGTVSAKDYDERGKYSHTTQSERFGSWKRTKGSTTLQTIFPPRRVTSHQFG